MPDPKLELEAIRDVVSLTGFKIANIRPAYPELGSAELGLDVLFDLDGRRVGAQHTTFHSDEGHTAGERGSRTRAKEERIARITRAPFGLWGKFDYRPALRLPGARDQRPGRPARRPRPAPHPHRRLATRPANIAD